MQCATKSSKVIRNSNLQNYILKRKGKMKTCMLLYVILHICNFYVILIFAYLSFGGGLGAAVRLPCGPTPRNSCK